MRVLVTGSRNWENREVIYRALYREWHASGADATNFVLIHGDCPTGADAIADAWGKRNMVDVERHPADWTKHGKRAGFLRNAEMVALGADVCLAFIKGDSRGATMTADLAQQASIRTVRYTA